MKEISRRVEGKATLQYISQTPSLMPFIMVPLGTALLSLRAPAQSEPPPQSPRFVQDKLSTAMLKAALKNICRVRNRLFPLRVLGESWESHRILQTAHKHGRCVLFSFILICICFWSCKTLCICLTLSLFPINWSSPFNEALLSFLTSSGCCFSFLHVLLPTLKNLLFSHAHSFPPNPLLQCGNHLPNWQRGEQGKEPARSQPRGCASG